MRMRYQENRTVKYVLAWLLEQNCAISRRSYHEFMLRVLRVLPLEQAREFGVSADLLRAIRVRYQMPVDPKGVRAGAGKSTPRHDSRARRRRILPVRKAQLARVSSAHVLRGEAHPAAAVAPLSSAGMVSPPGQAEPPKMLGTMENPVGQSDWIIINKIARDKVFAKDRLMTLNDRGRARSMRTGRDYTEEELMKEFGLTEIEAISCFQTLPSQWKAS